MDIITKNIPEGVALDYPMDHGECLPDVAIESGKTIVFPAFVHQNTEDGGYDWIPVRIALKGQTIGNYAKLEKECYAELRKFFYGTTEQQLELQFKGKFDEHIRAIRKAFPNPYKGEKRTVFSRFEVLKAFEKLPELYTRLVAAYTSNTEINLFWNSVNSIDIENKDCQRICSTLNIDDTLINQLIDIIDNQ